jgi:hypothetical protein
LEDLTNSWKCADEELKYLRQSKAEVVKEKDDLLRDLHAYKGELESLYKANRELKKKMKS